jgi:hypothetical protein
MSAPKPSLSEFAKALEAAGGPRLYPYQRELLARLERGERLRLVWMRDPGKPRAIAGTQSERPAEAATRSATSGLR